jgi:hypothetical protein
MGRTHTTYVFEEGGEDEEGRGRVEDDEEEVEESKYSFNLKKIVTLTQQQVN